MRIDNCNLEKIKQAGYTEHPKGNGYIRQIGRSRFHILTDCEGYDLHFDRTRRGVHNSRGYNDQVVGEVRRINKII